MVPKYGRHAHQWQLAAGTSAQAVSITSPRAWGQPPETRVDTEPPLGGRLPGPESRSLTQIFGPQEEERCKRDRWRQRQRKPLVPLTASDGPDWCPWTTSLCSRNITVTPSLLLQHPSLCSSPASTAQCPGPALPGQAPVPVTLQAPLFCPPGLRLI